MRIRTALASLAVIAIVGLGAWWWRSTARPAVVPAGQESRTPAGCDPLPSPGPLPAGLAPTAPTVEAVVQALDASLNPRHKAFLLCFPDEDALVARVHFGLGRWLRTSLHLWSNTPLTAAMRTMGATSADEMSSAIIRVYARALHHAPLDVAGAVARARAKDQIPE